MNMIVGGNKQQFLTIFGDKFLAIFGGNFKNIC